MFKYVLFILAWIIIGAVIFYVTLMKFTAKVVSYGLDIREYVYDYLFTEIDYDREHTNRIKKLTCYGWGVLITWPTALNNVCNLMDKALTKNIHSYATREESY